MCQPDISALFRAPALLEIGFLSIVPGVSNDFSGTTESSGHYSTGTIGGPPLQSHVFGSVVFWGAMGAGVEQAS